MSTERSDQLNRALVETSRWICAVDNQLEPGALFDALIARIQDAGIELFRASASLMTMHPEVYGKHLLWRRGGKTEVILRPHTTIESAQYMSNPPMVVRRDRVSIRVPLEQPEENLRFPLCVQLKDEGATDYFILPVPFRSGAVSFVSWTTDKKGGFSDEEISFFEDLVPVLSMRMELESAGFALRTLLETYLGKTAAERVLKGKFKHGEGEHIRAAIWACDLRGFTALADRYAIDTVLPLLDEFFACVADPFVENGGEVLNISGDAVFGVFPILEGKSTREACERALEGAVHAFVRAEQFNRRRKKRGEPTIRFGVALHIGDVTLGNIGAKGRLDFTVVGSAVNAAVRLEGQCKILKQPLLATSDFVAEVKEAVVESMGMVDLRGLSEPVEVFAIPAPFVPDGE